MTSSQDWGPARRFGFRFGVVFGALEIFPFPLTAMPKLDWLTQPLGQARAWVVQWFAHAVLGLALPASEFNGSGDRTLDYSRPAPDRLVIDGVHLGHALHIALHAAPAPLLVTRGFHWVNESPFSR